MPTRRYAARRTHPDPATLVRPIDIAAADTAGGPSLYSMTRPSVLLPPKSGTAMPLAFAHPFNTANRSVAS
jgi:hypothetical protein